MRAFTLLNATKVVIMSCALILSLTGFAEARDRNGNGHFVSRSHQRDRGQTIAGVNASRRFIFDRGHRDFNRRHGGRGESIAGLNASRRFIFDRRDRGFRIIGLSADRFDRRYIGDPRFNGRFSSSRYFGNRFSDRQIVIRRYNAQGGDWGSYGGGDFPSTTGGGTYFGGLSAWTDPGIGTYFRSQGSGFGYDNGDEAVNYYQPRAKIIRVNPANVSSGCSFEAGVCVIRR